MRLVGWDDQSRLYSTTYMATACERTVLVQKMESTGRVTSTWSMISRMDRILVMGRMTEKSILKAVGSECLLKQTYTYLLLLSWPAHTCL